MEEFSTRMEELGTRMEVLGTRMEELAEAQKQTTAHLSVLTEIVGDLGRAQTSLTKRFEEYISSRP
jgi:gamma-glutamylcysteine synthetase